MKRSGLWLLFYCTNKIYFARSCIATRVEKYKLFIKYLFLNLVAVRIWYLDALLVLQGKYCDSVHNVTVRDFARRLWPFRFNNIYNMIGLSCVNRKSSKCQLHSSPKFTGSQLTKEPLKRFVKVAKSEVKIRTPSTCFTLWN